MAERAGVAAEVEREVERLGYEVVEMDEGGRGPAGAPGALRMRIDRPDTLPEPGQGVTIDECVEVTRALRAFLAVRLGEDAVPELEVSTPGLDRPLVRRRDWDRFAGYVVGVQGRQPLAPNGQKRFEGGLLGATVGEDDGRARLQLDDGTEMEFGLRELDRARLVYRWKKPEKPGRGSKPAPKKQTP